MRRLAVTVLIALSFVWFGACRSCMAQQIIGRPMLPLSSAGPASISGVRYWWISSDISAGVVTGNWIDRINGYGLGNSTGANQPTNTATGVHFNGAQILTNSPTFLAATNGVSDSKGAFWAVITPTTPVSFGTISGTSGGWGFYTTSAGVFREFGESGSPTWSAYLSGTSCDIGVDMTSTTSSTNAFFKNGVVISTGVTAGMPNGNMASVGKEPGGANPYKGYILEIAYFSRHLTPAEMSTLHTYAATKYGY